MALAIALLAGAGFWLRVDGARSIVLPEGRPARLLGTDAYDHLRRAAAIAGTLPRELAPRPVSEEDWVRPGLFDRLLALPALASGESPPSLDTLVAWSVWVPPGLGALSIVALFALARRFLPPPDAWLTALLYVLYPGESLDRTTLGFADHHAAEILLTLLALWALVRELQAFNILTVPGTGFGTPGHFRVSYAVERDLLERSLPVWKQAAEKLGLSKRDKKVPAR